MGKSIRKSAAQVATIATGVAAAWYLVHQVWRAIYFAYCRFVLGDHGLRQDLYLGIDD